MSRFSVVMIGVIAVSFCGAETPCALNPVFPLPSALIRESPAEFFPAGPRFIDKTGRVVPADRVKSAQKVGPPLIPFQKIARSPSWGYRDRSGIVTIDGGFRKAGEFSESFAAVQDASLKWGFIDQTGRMRIEPQFRFAGAFSDGLAAVDLCGKCGYIDKSGKSAFAGEFRSCYSFSEGIAKVEVSKGSWAFITKTGKVLAELSGAWGEQALLSEDLIPAGKPGARGIGFVNREGVFVIEPRFSAVHAFSEGLAAVTEDELWGYIDKSGKLVIKPQFCEPANENFGQFLRRLS